MVLKESWVDSGLSREGINISRIKEMATGDEISEYVGKALLTVLTHGDVAVEGVTDFTRELFFLDDAPSKLSSRPKRLVHYRIVFKEVCRALKQERHLSSIFKVLWDMSKSMFS